MEPSGGREDDRAVQVSSIAERVLAADPTVVWALLGDPARTGEWAAVTTVGYMGTELPKTGQAVFIRTHWWQRTANSRRIEVESWDPGAGYRCIVEASGRRAPLQFEVSIKPEVSAAGIETRVRLTQRTKTRAPLAAIVQRYVGGRLERKLNRIERVTTR